MSKAPARATAVIAVALAAALLAGCTDGAAPPEGTSVAAPESRSVEPSATPTSENPPDVSLESQLSYLIEEEKLAHDVYVALGDLWGARIFDNIAASETTHEEAVAELLAVYGVDDPRSPDPGVFTDPALQALHDELLARGSQSLADAIAVGVTIEQTDIADLSDAIPTAPGDVAIVLERLLAASQNHLAAFERQI